VYSVANIIVVVERIATPNWVGDFGEVANH
jgi:hypothetical protein